jgi:hypothetical protein
MRVWNVQTGQVIHAFEAPVPFRELRRVSVWLLVRIEKTPLHERYGWYEWITLTALRSRPTNPPLSPNQNEQGRLIHER